MDSYVFFACNGPIHSQKTPRVGPISSLAANSRRAAAVSWHGPADWAPAGAHVVETLIALWPLEDVGSWVRLSESGVLEDLLILPRVMTWDGPLDWTGWEESCLHMVVEEKLGQRSRITKQHDKRIGSEPELAISGCGPMPGVSCLLKVVLHRVFPHRAKFQAVIWNWNQLIPVYCRLCLAVLEISTIFRVLSTQVAWYFRSLQKSRPQDSKIRKHQNFDHQISRMS